LSLRESYEKVIRTLGKSQDEAPSTATANVDVTTTLRECQLVEMVKLRHHAKLRRNRSNRCRSTVIIRFSKMAAIHHLGLLCACSVHPRRAFGGLYRCPKFGWNRCRSFDNMHLFRFRKFGFKTPIHGTKFGFGGISPLNGEPY